MSLGAESPDHLRYKAKGSKNHCFLMKCFGVFLCNTNILTLDLLGGNGMENNQLR